MTNTVATPAAEAPRGQSTLLLLLLKLRTFIALIAVVVFFSLMAPNFVTVANVVIVSKHVAINAFLAIGMTFVILTGGIDLSVGAIVGLVGMVAGALVLYGIPLQMFGVVIYPNVWEMIGIALLVGTFVGFVNGLLITRMQVAPFIATLGMLYVARGTALLMSGGSTFPNLIGKPEFGNQGFPVLGSGTILGIPLSIWLLLVVAGIAAYVATKTPFGRQVYAVGGNERAATLSGVNVNRVKLAVYMISGFCAAIAGLVVASQLVASHPASGETFEMNAIAAAVLGGTSLSGGRGTIGGTIVGAFVIGVLSDGLVMMGVSEFWQMVIKGVVIVGAVILDQMQRRIARNARLG
ncbi:Ribose transport system permease protein RbsC [uncultured Pleomorphomonas sp.]|uniref:Ribose transport system permease protein RbsC n=1 Tax=uncultured Pleomorphomonas sp. TaxID=442121 RepID=A0A212LIX2_9HYPH|nr:ABC transporter permease [uncultured Pleomorphomonas sp.]SCM77484.1 Ribose transport system permease protein RbsC [uncultured Pleomorphomonas sp.]